MYLVSALSWSLASAALDQANYALAMGMDMASLEFLPWQGALVVPMVVVTWAVVCLMAPVAWGVEMPMGPAV